MRITYSQSSNSVSRTVRHSSRAWNDPVSASSMTKCSSLLIPVHNLQVELVVIRIFSDGHVKVMSTFMCVKTVLSLRCSRRLHMLLNMSTAETAGLLCCPRIAMTDQGLWNNTCYGIFQLLDFSSPLLSLYCSQKITSMTRSALLGRERLYSSGRAMAARS